MDQAQIEAVARAYCRKLGLDPDAMVHHVNGAHIPHGATRWRLAAEDVRNALAMQEAIAEVQAVARKGDPG